MAPHQQRVIDEAAELKDRFQKLNAFIDSNPIFKTLAPEEQSDMRSQVSHMESYWECLDRRIKRF